MPRHSLNSIHTFTGFSRNALQARVDDRGLDSPYDPRDLLDLKEKEVGEKKSTLEQARTRQAEADARLKELQASKLEGVLCDADEMLEFTNEFFDGLAAEIKKTDLPDDTKEKIFKSISDLLKKCSKQPS